MHSTLIVARMDPTASAEVVRAFQESDATELPALLGTRRRQLFSYRGLYFHVQDFDSDDGGAAIERVREHPLFVKVSSDLRPFIRPYDPATWRTPADARATCFYHWSGRS